MQTVLQSIIATITVFIQLVTEYGTFGIQLNVRSRICARALNRQFTVVSQGHFRFRLCSIRMLFGFELVYKHAKQV